MNKLEVNAALWNLVQRINIPEACEIVIQYGNNLSEEERVSLEITLHKDPDEGFTGHTELGNVTVPGENQKDELETIEVLGKKHRIGHFKMTRNGNEIAFHHFWASNETTSADEDEPETFSIIYNPDTLRCLCFGIWSEEVKFRFGIIAIKRRFVEVIYGDPEETSQHWMLNIG